MGDHRREVGRKKKGAEKMYSLIKIIKRKKIIRYA